MAQLRANGITIDYEETGAPDSPPLVLIRGLGTQRIMWPEPFVHGLASRGFRVICFDNRDVGGTTKLDGAGPANISRAMRQVASGEPVDAPYTLDDMARDTVGLLDALGIERAHIVGISMGGMIAQVVAARHGDRVRSLVSIMSSSGNPDLPPARPEAMQALLSQPDKPGDRESVVQHAIEVQRIIGSPGFPTEEAELRDRAERAFDRCYCPEGIGRQMLAILASGSRVDLLKGVRAPTLVIHGEEDPLAPVEGGIDTARHVPGARLERIKGMGHDIAPGLVATLVEAIANHARDADLRRA